MLELTKGKLCMVEVQDLPLLSPYRWTYVIGDRGTERAMAYIDGKSKAMHRLLLGATDPKIEVDHKNRNQLDNRRSNLRLASRSQNEGNKSAQSNNTSGFKGVTWNKDMRKWQAQIRMAKKDPILNWGYIGLFDTAEKAARAYDSMALGRWGDFALLNFPITDYCTRTA